MCTKKASLALKFKELLVYFGTTEIWIVLWWAVLPPVESLRLLQKDQSRALISCVMFYKQFSKSLANFRWELLQITLMTTLKWPCNTTWTEKKPEEPQNRFHLQLQEVKTCFRSVCVRQNNIFAFRNWLAHIDSAVTAHLISLD